MDPKTREFPSLPKLTGAPREKSRVCIASFDFVGPVRNGGVGTAFTSLGEALAAAGHEVTFLYLSGTWCENLKLGHWIDHYAAKNIRFVPMPEPPQLRVEAPWHAIRSYHAYLWLREQNFDVIHFSEWRAPGYYSILSKHQGLAFQKTLLCVHTHGPTLWSRLSNGEYLSTVEDIELDEMERFSVKQTDVVVSPSRYLLRWMQEQGWSLPQATYVQQYVQPATATAAPASQRNPSQPIPVRELVFFGRLEVRKGLVLFCDALDRLKDDPSLRSLRLTFLGKITPIHGREGREYLEHRSRQWPWRWKIISDKDQPGALAHLRQSGCLAILPSLVDNLPNTVLECLGAQVPFVTSDIGGIPEMVAPEDFQRTCSPLRAPALAQRIRAAVVEGSRPVAPAVDAEATRHAWLDWHARQNEAERSPLSVQLASASPLVSICMSHFNRPNYLRQALASIEAQDYPNLEVVLVDDASTDKETIRYLDQLEPQFTARGWQLIRNEEEAFVGAARNLAARSARGEYIKFMDDDNCAKPNEISTFVRVARHTGADILTCFLDFFSGHNPPNPTEPPNFRLLFLGATPGPGVFRNCFGDTNSLIRRDVFLALGGFHEHRGVGHEDWELFGDALLKGYKLEVVPEALVWYRRNDTGDNITVRNSVHGGHMRNIRPFLDAVPAPLRNVILFAQGHEIAHRGDGGFAGGTHGDLHQVIRWRSLLEAGRVLGNLNQREEAIRLLVEAVNKAEITQHPVLILEAVLEVGREMRRLDPRRARGLLELGLQLATTIRNAPAQKVAKSLLAEIPEDAPIAPAPSPPTPSQPAAAVSVSRSRSAAPVALSSFTPTGPIRVSVVIPLFNKVELTRQCLEALDNDGSTTAREIILVDNGSIDGTAAFLREAEACGRVRCIRNEQNLGFAHACNQGARAGIGDYVLFLNNDTEVRPGWLEAMLAVADKDPNVAAVGSKLLFPDGTLQHAGVVLAEYPGRDPLLATHIYYRANANLAEANERRVYPACTAACLLVRKTSFEAIGGLDEEFWNGYEDVDLCLRLQERGWHCVYEPASVVVHHESQSGPERFHKVQANIKRLHSKWLGKAKLDARCHPNGKLEMLAASNVRPYDHDGDTQSFSSFTSIVILTHNQLADTRLCLESIAAHTPQAHEVIIIDNGSTDGTPDYLRSLSNHRREIHCIFNKTNRGFAAAVNQGLARSRGDQVVILNNDTVLTPGWLSGLLDVLARHPRTGLVGPVTNYVSGPQLVKDVPYKQFEELPVFARQWAQQYAGKTQRVERLVGFCLVARRAVIEAIGGFDEGYGSGNFEDDDFCLRAGLAGFESEIAQQVFIHHTGSQTFKGAKIDYRASMLNNWRRFKGKWGLPADAPIEQGYQLPLQLVNPHDLKVPLSDLPAGGDVAPKPMVTPLVARVGDLKEATALRASGDLPAAWQAGLNTLQCRPFHPEAWLFLAEVAWSAGRQDLVKKCVAEAERMAPNWKPVRRFLKKHPARPANQTLPLAPLPAPRSLRLTVCLMVRNEEEMLPRCLKSVKDVADQIVVVDTGSTDQTIAVAKQCGAEVYQTDWTDDFSAPRNLALEKANGDWILMLDADEELSESGRARLRTEMQSDGVLGYRLPIVDAGREEEGAHYVPRLFRNAPGLFYVGRIHEQVFSSLQVRQQEWSLENVHGKTMLIHHGYSRERIAGRDKIARNLRLLELALTDDPKDPNILMNLGLELTRSGRREEGIKRYWEAVQIMSALAPEHIVPELRETLLTQLSAHLSAQSDFSSVVRLLRSPLARNGGLSASLHFALGLALMNLRRMAEATDEFRHCITKRNQPALCPINTEIRKAAPRHCLAMCQAELKQTEAAGASFEEALKEDPSSRALRLDYARFLAESGDPIAGLRRVHELIAENISDAEIWITGARLSLAKPDFLEFALDWTGESIKHVSSDATLIALRAEALMLSGRIEEALPFWEQAGDQPVATAARALCETALGRSLSVRPEKEQATSQEFLKWYRRLIDFNAELTILAVNNHLSLLQPVLPTVTNVLEAALVEAN